MSRCSLADRCKWLAIALVFLATACGQEDPVQPDPGSDGRPELARPQEWTFVGRAKVTDPAGNPQSGVRFRLFAQLARDDFGEETDFCSATGFTDAQGEAFLSCDIEDSPNARPIGVSLSLSDPAFTVISESETSRTALDVRKTYVAIADSDGNSITDAVELALARKFAPKLILTAGDNGVRPSPVEIMDRNGDGRLGWEDMLVRVYNIAGTSLGEFRLDEILFYDSQAGYWIDFRNRYPYLALIMKDHVIPGFVVEGNTVIPLNPPTIYILVPHLEWGEVGETNPTSWYASWDQAMAAHAGDSRYENGTTYADLFRGPSGEVIIQYWFFYPFNNSGNRHEGDWEHINVVITSDNVAAAELDRVEYYYHEEVAVKEQPGVDFEVVDETHPVVYVGGFTGACQNFGYGTHGSFWRPGIINGINALGGQERVGGDGLEIDFDDYQNVVLMPNDMPRPVFASDPDATYDVGWQTYGAFWGHPLSKPLSCGSDLDLFSGVLSGFLALVQPGGPIGGVIAMGLQLANAMLEDHVLEEINMAPPGPRYNTRWQTTETPNGSTAAQ